MASVVCPDTGRAEFRQISVRVTKIEAFSAAFAVSFALYGDTERDEMSLPIIVLGSVNGKREVEISAAVVSRDNASGRFNIMRRSSLLEKEQHLSIANRKSVQTFILDKRFKSEYPFVELRRPRRIGDIKRRFQYPIDLRHGSFSCFDFDALSFHTPMKMPCRKAVADRA
jgi:hypothetical protein